jgi:hypothetical protein
MEKGFGPPHGFLLYNFLRKDTNFDMGNPVVKIGKMHTNRIKIQQIWS